MTCAQLGRQPVGIVHLVELDLFMQVDMGRRTIVGPRVHLALHASRFTRRTLVRAPGCVRHSTGAVADDL